MYKPNSLFLVNSDDVIDSLSMRAIGCKQLTLQCRERQRFYQYSIGVRSSIANCFSNLLAFNNTQRKKEVMGSKSSRSKGQPTRCEPAKQREVRTCSMSGKTSYMHAVPEGVKRENADVGCIIAYKSNKDLSCGVCLMELDLAKEIFNSRQRDKAIKAGHTFLPDARVDQHFCTNCDTIMCLQCGDLLNNLLLTLDDQALNECGGCQVQLKRSVRKAKDRVQESITTTSSFMLTDAHYSCHVDRRHDFCPMCNRTLAHKFQVPFKEHVKQLLDEVVFVFEDDKDTSFVLVDVKSLPADKRNAMLEESAQVTPLTPLELREKQRSDLITKLSSSLELLERAKHDSSLDVSAAQIEVGGCWFQLAERCGSIEVISVTPDMHVDKIDCYRHAVQSSPDNILFLCALLANMAKRDTVTIDGNTLVKCQVGERIVRFRPSSPEAWRNVALFMDARDKISVEGQQYSRNDCLQKSIDLAPSESIGWYAAAFFLCPQSYALSIDGVEQTREEILTIMVNDAENDNETLEELVERFFGKNFLVFMMSELSLLCADHPRVKQYAAQFRMQPNGVIGMGAFGEVYKAERLFPDNKTREPLAAKVMTTDLKAQTFNSVPELHMLMSHLFQEVVTRAHYVSYDAKSRRATVFMELAQLGSTFSFMKNTVKGRLHESELRSVFKQVLVALRLLHYYGVVHQDIKPPNLLVFSGMNVKLADFGVTCLTYCDLAEMTAGGTEVYMPPEAFNDGAISTAGDVWSLAATVIELASFHHPVPDPAYVNTRGARHPFRPFIPTHLSDELKGILASMLNYDPAQRPSAGQLLQLPYFCSGALPASAESIDLYNRNKTESGIPKKIRDLEELSTMGLSTRRLETMTTGTMALPTMRVMKTQLVQKNLERQMDNPLLQHSNSLSPQEVDTGVPHSIAEQATSSEAPRFPDDNGDDIPTVSPVSPSGE